MCEYAWICLNNIIYQHPVWNLHENKLNLSDLNFLKLNYWNFWILGRCSLYILNYLNDLFTVSKSVSIFAESQRLMWRTSRRRQGPRMPSDAMGCPWDPIDFPAAEAVSCRQLMEFQLPPFRWCSGHEACWVNILKVFVELVALEVFVIVFVMLLFVHV